MVTDIVRCECVRVRCLAPRLRRRWRSVCCFGKRCAVHRAVCIGVLDANFTAAVRKCGFCRGYGERRTWRPSRLVSGIKTGRPRQGMSGCAKWPARFRAGLLGAGGRCTERSGRLRVCQDRADAAQPSDGPGGVAVPAQHPRARATLPSGGAPAGAGAVIAARPSCATGRGHGPAPAPVGTGARSLFG